MSNSTRTQANTDWQTRAIQQLSKFMQYNIPASTASSMGNIQLTDLNLLGDYTRILLQSMGIWSPHDAWKLYSEPDPAKRSENLSYLKSLSQTEHFGGVGNPDPVKTVAKLIFLAPSRDPSVSYQQIETDIKAALASSFFEIRREELRKYLKALGIGNGKTNGIVLQNPGAELTKAIMKQEYQNFFSSGLPSDQIIVQGKTRRRYQPPDAKAFLRIIIKQAIFDAGVSGVLRNGIIDTDRFTNADFHEYFKLPKGTPLTNAQYTEILDTISDMVKQKELESDMEFGIRLPAKEQSQKIFEPSAIRIGKTHSPQLLMRFQRNLDEKNIEIGKLGKLGDKRPTGYRGLFVTQPTQTGVNMRFTATLLPKDDDDVEDVIDAIGIDPKTGFAPYSYEHSDLSVVEQFPLYNVFLYPSMSDANRFLPIKSVQENQNEWILSVKKSPVDNHSNHTVWQITGNMKKSYTEIKKQEDDPFLQDFASNHKYVGSLCPLIKYGHSTYIDTRNKMGNIIISLRDYMLSYKKSPHNIQDSHLSDMISEIENRALILQSMPSPIEFNSTKQIYSVPTPTCQVSQISGDSIVIQKYSEIKPATRKKAAVLEETNISKKLTRIKEACKNAPDISKCMGKQVLLSQNITDTYLGSSGVSGHPVSPISIRLSKLTDDPDSSRQNKKVADEFTELAFSKISGIPMMINGSPINRYQETDIMESARIDGTPLSVNKWKFIPLLSSSFNIFQ